MSEETGFVMEEALRFIESPEIADYLLNTEPLRLFEYCDIIAGARASLEEKAAALRRVSLKCEPDEYCDPGKMAESALAALDETRNGPPGTVFLLTELFRRGRRSYRTGGERTTLFTSFDAALNSLRGQKTKYGLDDIRDRLWFYIEKWVPDENGAMRSDISWNLDEGGKIWFFDVDHDVEEPYKTLGKNGDAFRFYSTELYF